jgi:hypothetical protein
MLDLAQVFAWSRMFAGYARSESIVAAARETFNPDKPCAICRAVSRAREASGQHAPPVPRAGSDRILLILENPAPFVAAAPARSWPDAVPGLAATRSAEVPVPPPRSVQA